MPQSQLRALLQKCRSSEAHEGRQLIACADENHEPKLSLPQFAPLGRPEEATLIFPGVASFAPISPPPHILLAYFFFRSIRFRTEAF